MLAAGGKLIGIVCHQSRSSTAFSPLIRGHRAARISAAPTPVAASPLVSSIFALCWKYTQKQTEGVCISKSNGWLFLFICLCFHLCYQAPVRSISGYFRSLLIWWIGTEWEEMAGVMNAWGTEAENKDLPLLFSGQLYANGLDAPASTVNVWKCVGVSDCHMAVGHSPNPPGRSHRCSVSCNVGIIL